jgi:hypothetical protein
MRRVSNQPPPGGGRKSRSRAQSRIALGAHKIFSISGYPSFYVRHCGSGRVARLDHANALDDFPARRDLL